MRSNDDDNLILFPSSKNFEVKLDKGFNLQDDELLIHSDIEVDDSLIREIEDSIEALDVKNIDRLTKNLTTSEILEEDFIDLPQAPIFVGDYPQLDFEIDLMTSEELIELIGKQQATLAEHQARINFFIDDLDDTLN